MPSSARVLAPLAPNTPFQEACKLYIERRKQYLRPRSIEAYQYHFRTLQRFFAPDRHLSAFHEGDFRDYQKWRSQSAAGARKAGPSVINHELGALAQVLDLAGLWHAIQKYYERLPARNWAPPKVLTAEEEERFFRFAAGKSEWRTAYNSARLTCNSTIAGCELRTLRLEDLQLEHNPPLIHVRGAAKNRHRVRGVPLNAIALRAAQDLLVLAKERGSIEPRHHLIPFRIKKGVHDPLRPASPYFIRAAFRAIGHASGLKGVTPSSFRHQAITKLLESGAPDETVRAIAGHVSEKAMRFYSHIRIAAKKTALDRLEPIEKPAEVRRRKYAGTAFPLLRELRHKAGQLGITADAAIELVLSYERSKSLRGNESA
jgi:integrase